MSHHHQPSLAYPAFATSSLSGSSMQSFEPPYLELYRLQTGMQMLEMMPAKHQHGNIMPSSSSWSQPNGLVDEDSSFSFDGSNRFYSNISYELRNSKYLIPAQELLKEFCNLKEIGITGRVRKHKSRLKEEDQSSVLFSMDSFQLQSCQAKLFSMQEEVDRRYKRYCEQMRAVVSSFEAVAGQGSAAVYSALASKAMSRHFRCLRDAIMSQIQATKMAMGEKDPIEPWTTKGETPRLKLIDQCIRQQKQFQQGGMMEIHAWRPQRGLPERSVTVLRAWLFEHFLHPYPSDVDKLVLARQTGLSRRQISNWFINARVRLWKPMVEEMYMEEEKEQDNANQSFTTPTECENSQNPNPTPDQDQKPILPTHISYTDSDLLTSIMITNNNHGSEQDERPRAENFGVAELDFSSYNNYACNQNSGNRVSLTLGLQQWIFFSRDRQVLDDCEQVQFSILGGSE